MSEVSEIELPIEEPLKGFFQKIQKSLEIYQEQKTFRYKDHHHLNIPKRILKILYTNNKTNPATRVDNLEIKLPGSCCLISKKHNILQIPTIKATIAVPRSLLPPTKKPKILEVTLRPDSITITYEKSFLERLDFSDIPPPEHWIGIDINSTKEFLTIANTKTDTARKAGEIISKRVRGFLQLQKNKPEMINEPFLNWYEDMITKEIEELCQSLVEECKNTKCGVRTENLLNLDEDYDMKGETFIWVIKKFQRRLLEKCHQEKIYCELVAPNYSSQIDHKTGELGKRIKNHFRNKDGEVIDADINAAFNIAKKSHLITTANQPEIFCLPLKG